MRVNKGDKVTLSRTETKIVTATHNYTDKCLSAEDGDTYHLEGACPNAEARTELWTVEHVESTPADWPPQENDVWESPAFTYHIIGNEAYFGHKIKPAPGHGKMTLDTLKGLSPVLKYRKK